MSDATQAEVRPLRICDVCGQVDDHPRHLVMYAPDTVPVNQEHLASVIAMDGVSAEDKASIIADIIDTTTQYRHMDCCRSLGCVPEGAEDGTTKPGPCMNMPDLQGPALLAHIQGA